MTTALVVSVADPKAIAAEWSALAERVGASPFLHPQWIEAWWSAFGEGTLEARVVRRTADSALEAVLPVVVRRRALSSPTNWHSPEFGVVSSSTEATRTLVASLFEAQPRRLSLAFLGDDDATSVAQGAAAQGYRVIRRVRQRSPYVPIDGTWQAYEQRLSTKMRSDLKRRERLMAQRGRVSIDVEVASGAKLDAFLEEGLAVEASGWKGSGGTAIQSQPNTRRFYTDVAHWAAARGWLSLGFLRLDGRAIAFSYGLEHHGVHYLLKSGYDPAYRELSPGKLIRRAMLMRAFFGGARSYEFLGADEAWKLEWADASRPRELVQGFRPSVLGLLDWSLFAYGRPLAKRLRDRARKGLGSDS